MWCGPAGEEEMKASLAALSFLLSNAAKYGISEATFANELQQLGLPREHSLALCRVFSERSAALTAEGQNRSLRTSRLVDAKARRHGTSTILTLTYWSALTDCTSTKEITVSNDSLTLLLHGKYS